MTMRRHGAGRRGLRFSSAMGNLQHVNRSAVATGRSALGLQPQGDAPDRGPEFAGQNGALRTSAGFRHALTGTQGR
jgi:hypothetical protein